MRRDGKETGEKPKYVDWSYIFFKLAKYLGMSKEDIYTLTLPQLDKYLSHLDEHVKFEFEYNANSVALGIAKAFGEGKDEDGEYADDSEYDEATEDDIDMLTQLLGGM